MSRPKKDPNAHRGHGFGLTAGQRVLAWLGAGNAATCMQMAQRFDLPLSTVIAAVNVLKASGLVEAVGADERSRGGSRGQLPKLWVAACTQMPAPRTEVAAQYLPLSRTPAREIVRQAIANQHPLAAAWLHREAA